MSGALLVGVDAAEWAGEELFQRGTTAVDAPALDVLHDGGHYPDVVGLLNGWSSARTLTAMLQADWSVTGTVTAYLTDAGYFALDILGAAGEWLVYPGTSDPWGWGGTVHSVDYGTGHTLTATRPWARGDFVADSDAIAQVWAAVGGGEWDIVELPPRLQRVQSMPHWLGIGDSDAVSETLEKWDNAANDATHKRIRWGIDDEGRAWTSWPSALSLGALSWTSATFRRALGFTGSEVVTTTNSVRLLRGTYPARGVLILRQGLSVMDGGLVRSATSANTAAGRVVGRQAGHWRDLLVTSTLRGGLGVPTALAEVRDEAEIYQTNIWPLLWPGQRVTVCPEWGESRVATTRHAAFAAGAAIQPGNWSARGRHRCEVSTEMDLRQSLSWPRTSGPRILTSPVTWALRELP